MFEKEIIKGMIYLPEFITQNEEKELVLYLMEKEWNTSLKRRTQHYGYTYSYDKNNTLEAAQPIPGIFGATKKFIEVYIKDNLEEQYDFDQIIVNEYLPGQGISPHIDNQVLFDGMIVSLSLNSETIMVFENQKGGKVEKLLERRSLLILTNDSRFKWKHSIPSRKSDHGIQRKTRFSLTFRKTLKPKQQK